MSRRCWALRRDGRPCRAIPAAGKALCTSHERQRQGVLVWGGPADGRRVRPVSDRAVLVRVICGVDGTHRVVFPGVALCPGERTVGWYRLEDHRSGLWRVGWRYRWYEQVAGVSHGEAGRRANG